MKPHIPPPLDPYDFSIEVVDATGPDAPEGRGDTCATLRERTQVPADVQIASSSEWLRYAVSAALRGHLPRTQCIIVPTRSGGVAFNLGRGDVPTPMVFGGATCRPEPWGRQCDEGAPLVLPEHEALAPAPRARPAVDVSTPASADEIVLFDGFDWLDWPAWRSARGEA